jgi:S-methylmethionine-dependent homocysteine/selenocysteine methylase
VNRKKGSEPFFSSGYVGLPSAAAGEKKGSDPFFLIDGGTGTELRRRGIELDPVAWSAPAALTHAGVLAAIHSDYLDAGADVITTNTFGATRFVLEAAGLGGSFERIVRSSVAAAHRARDRSGRDALIAGSVSCFPPAFDAAGYPHPATEVAAYSELATLLAELGVDLLVLEMMEDTQHARRACDAIHAVGLPFWLGVSARRAANGDLVAYDFPATRFADVLDSLLGYAPAVVNVMHTPAEDVTAALDALTARWTGAVGAYPEAGDTAQRKGGANVDPAQLAAFAEEWLRRGIRVLGGCCGTSPEHVRALRTLLDEHRRSDAAG